MNHKAGFVNIIGRPNAGKSTLMNALIGEKLSIITPKAQTTRHRILGILNDENYQIVFSDTPGIINPAYQLQEKMMDWVSESLVDADVIIFISDISQFKKDSELFTQKLNSLTVPKILVLNKIDLSKQEDIDQAVKDWSLFVKPENIIPVSALNKTNLADVLKKIIELLPDHQPFFEKDQLTDKSERFFISEIIREKIFMTYQEEIPYATEVYVDSFKDEEKIVRIHATIYVNKRSQKPIIIGKGGMNLKKVGTEARIDIEKFLDKKVFLELFVKIKENWQNDSLLLKQFGYESKK